MIRGLLRWIFSIIGLSAVVLGIAYFFDLTQPVRIVALGYEFQAQLLVLALAALFFVIPIYWTVRAFLWFIRTSGAARRRNWRNRMVKSYASGQWRDLQKIAQSHSSSLKDDPVATSYGILGALTTGNTKQATGALKQLFGNGRQAQNNQLMLRVRLLLTAGQVNDAVRLLAEQCKKQPRNRVLSKLLEQLKQTTREAEKSLQTTR